MNFVRNHHSASLLINGTVLVAGGYDGIDYLTSAEVYDPSTGLWTTAGDFNIARAYHTASTLTNGQVLLVGGQNDDSVLSSAELYG
ncbi:unnamed protein product [Adineta steineri]|uniref:Uncharacterized protein n=1 Tax=Adineta steineri TaxID=433720 RepID=A0A820CRC7_9BILA|nr:unnamed protein product [Adineta steineri]